MGDDERSALLARYRSGTQAVRDAVAGLDDAALDRTPAGGGWTARQVVHHLADSEMTSAIRLRRLLAEDAPVIAAYDEEAFAKALRYDRPIATSLDAMVAARASSLSLLEVLDDDQWARTGTHSTDGPYGVETWLRIYADHAHDHADQLRRAAAGSS
jgi:hypothetical protein